MSHFTPKPEQASPEDKGTTHSHQSEQELIKMKKHFEDLPHSPPLTILSDEKWYPYSQYEFHRDGSLYADSAARVTTPSVPEVLSIVLPTGFDLTPSSNKSKPGTPPPPPSSYRATSTVVDFPSTPENNKSVINVERDAQQDSEERCGLHCMFQLLDLFSNYYLTYFSLFLLSFCTERN